MNKDWYKPYDSPEEIYVSWYLDELMEAGYVEEYVFQPSTFLLSPRQIYEWREVLKTKVKSRESSLLQSHEYTPDFSVKWHCPFGVSEMFIRFVYGSDKSKAPFWHAYDETGHDCESIWEIKPLFDRNNMTRLFTINQKWMYEKYGIYVQKIIPQKLFKQTFTPKRYLLTDMGKQKRKIDFTTRTLEGYIKSRTS